MTRTRKQLLVTFVFGAIVGAVGMYVSAPSYLHRHWDSGPFQTRLLQRFSSKLKLAPEQRTQVAAILEAKRQKIDALRADIRPKFEQIRTSTAADIRKLLTPEQQQKFDVMQAEWESRRRQRQGGHHEEG